MGAERATAGLIAALLAALATPASGQQDEHIFEPGKKHVCVPATSGQGWDCSAAEAPPAAAAETRREPRLRSSSEIPAEPAPAENTDEAAPATAAEPARAVTAPPAAVEPPASAAERSATPATASSAPAAAADNGRSRRVPSYLLAPGARDSAPAAEPVAANPAPPPPPAAPRSEPAPRATAAATPVPAASVTSPAAASQATPVSAPPAATQATAARETPPATAPPPAAPAPAAAPVTAPAQSAPAASTPTREAQASTPAVAEPAAAPPPVAAESIASAPTRSPLRGETEFRRLGDSRYVLELASGSDRNHVTAAAGQAALSKSQVYVLALRRDGAPWYLAVWGDFDSVDAARAARSQALAAGSAAGWPRRAGPLKQELRGEP